VRGSIERITVRDLVRGVASRWKDRYCYDGKWSDVFHGSSQTIYRKLCKLDGETASAQEVNGIIDNDSWTTLTCDVCGAERDEMFRIHDQYDEYTRDACRVCLTIALNLPPEKPSFLGSEDKQG
jgi:CRISPR/Cas system-associated protein Cas10 (large subunit of type III CRISPR-Cas system)